MNRALQILIVLLGTIVITSCGSTNSVVNKGLIQKRKHTSGWFFKTNSKQLKRSSDLEATSNNEVEISKDNLNNARDVSSRFKESLEEDVTVEFDNSILATTNTSPEHLEVNSANQNCEIKLKLKKDVILIEEQITSHENLEDTEIVPEEKNKVAIYSFVTMLIAALFISVGFAIMISSETFFLLTFGLAILLTSIILSILALTKYKHQEKSKVFAKITLYTILIAPVILLIIGFIIISQSPFFG